MKHKQSPVYHAGTPAFNEVLPKLLAIEWNSCPLKDVNSTATEFGVAQIDEDTRQVVRALDMNFDPGVITVDELYDAPLENLGALLMKAKAVRVVKPASHYFG